MNGCCYSNFFNENLKFAFKPEIISKLVIQYRCIIKLVFRLGYILKVHIMLLCVYFLCLFVQWTFYCIIVVIYISFCSFGHFQFDFPFVQTIRCKEVKFRPRSQKTWNYNDHNFSEIKYEMNQQQVKLIVVYVCIYEGVCVCRHAFLSVCVCIFS